MKYFHNTWLAGFYPISTWCSFQVKIRTNNDLEGWNNSLKQLANHNTNLYALCSVLEKEARMIMIQEQFVSLNQTQRVKRKDTVEFERELTKLWNNFNKKNINFLQLHKQLTDLLKYSNKINK